MTFAQPVRNLGTCAPSKFQPAERLPTLSPVGLRVDEVRRSTGERDFVIRGCPLLIVCIRRMILPRKAPLDQNL